MRKTTKKKKEFRVKGTAFFLVENVIEGSDSKFVPELKNNKHESIYLS